MEQNTGRIATLQVGIPTHHPTSVPANGVRTWQTSFFRVPSPTPRWLFTTHLDGNEQADKENHGQWNQAMLLYAAAHYPLWQSELDLPVIGPGGFGENVTVEGQSEATVCLGDRYAIGGAIIQITGPRYPCWKNAQRWGVADLLERIKATGRTGWYCSVEAEGMLTPGDAITLLDRPYPRWTIALINDFAHGHNADTALAEELCACPLLQEGFWPTVIHTTLKKQRT